jgi:circadian clock protein KaiC
VNRVATGIPGLDQVLKGGFNRGNAVLVEGTPGAGKTNLGLQFVYAGATDYDEPGLVVTFEEFSHQMIRDAQSLGWDLQSLIDDGKIRIIPTSPAVFQQEMAGAGGLIGDMVREMGAKRIVIDSVSHFARLYGADSERREVFNALINMLRRTGLTSLLTREVRVRTGLGLGEEVSFEQYASDAALRLSYEHVDATRRARYLEVIKARGQDFLAGKHVFDIGRGGIKVYPNFDPAEFSGEPPDRALERIPSGVPGLDEMLAGGLYRGFTTLVAGPSGVGKTAIGLQFLADGMAAGESGLYTSLRSGTAKLNRLARSLEIPLSADGDATIRFDCPHPAAINPYQVLDGILEAAEDGGISRVVLDSTREIESAFNDDARYEQFIFNLVHRLYAQGVTAMLLGGVGRAEDPGEPASTPIGGIVDSIVGLCHMSTRGEIRQGIYVLKSRGSGHSTDIRPYTISAGGLRVATRRVTVWDE